MKSTMSRITAVCLLISGLGWQATAAAEVSYNIGYASEYYFRGIAQKNSSASAGVDYEEGGFYIGTWAADVGDGLEIDGYFGYGWEIEDFTVSVGYTGYFYTGEFDDTYNELNLNLGFGIAGLEYSYGEYDNFGDEVNYDFTALTLEFEHGFYATVGAFGLIEDEAGEGEYLELGWGTTIAEIDFGIAAIINSKELSDQLDSDGDPTTGEAVIFTIGKTF